VFRFSRLFLIITLSNIITVQSALSSETRILFNGGMSPWNGAEISQLLQLNRWLIWSNQKVRGQTFPIYADGARTSEDEILLEAASSFASSNVVMAESDEKSGQIYLLGYRALVPSNLGPATYTTLEKAFNEASKRNGDVFLYVGSHGGSINQNLEMVCQNHLSPSTDTTALASLGLDSLGHEDSYIHGWHGSKWEGDDRQLLNDQVNGKTNRLITTKDLIHFREKLEGQTLRFIATQCFSGGSAWVAFNPDRKTLRGDTCGSTAATFYHVSSGCSPLADSKQGYGYHVAKALTENIDLDGDGVLSISDLHFYAFSNGQFDQSPQITTEIFLQKNGYLSWPIEADKEAYVEARYFKPFLEDDEELQQCSSKDLVSALFEKQNKNLMSKNMNIDLGPFRDELVQKIDDPDEDTSQKRAATRYEEILRAEKIFLEDDSVPEEVKENYRKVKACELAAF
jgi:hypothetical protein